MELLNFIFQLGVLFAIYGFLWGVFEILIGILAPNRKRSLIEVYILRGIKYLFLVNVTFVFCFENADSTLLALYKVFFAGLILLTYFIGKIQKNQMKSLFLSISQRSILPENIYFNAYYEKVIIAISIIAFALLWFFPDLAVNPISIWFQQKIIRIENTFLLGFIFKIIGFFFLLNIIGKMIATVNLLINGSPTNDDDFTDGNNLGNDGDFVEYEEVD